jgi:predicted alpha/beta hydrolase family esterase
MNKHLLFIQGGGYDGYEADKSLVTALQNALGKEYIIHYPELQSDENAPDFGWVQQIGTHIAQAADGVILVAHSLGASMLLKCLSEYTEDKKIAGVFLMAAPFWEGEEDWKKGLRLKPYFAAALPPHVSVFFYQCQDDEEVPVEQLIQYRKKLPFARFREFEKGGHQFSNNINFIVDDIRSV